MLFLDFLKKNDLLTTEGKVKNTVQLCDAKSSKYECDPQYTNDDYQAANNHPVIYISVPKPLVYEDVSFQTICLSTTLAGKFIKAKKANKKFKLAEEAEISTFIGDNGPVPCLQCVATRQVSDCADALDW